jgi:hypothetical protein
MHLSPQLAEAMAREQAAEILRSRRRLATGQAILAAEPDASERRWTHVAEAMAQERSRLEHARRALHRINQVRRERRNEQVTSLSTATDRRVHDVRGVIFGELRGVIVEAEGGTFRAYDQTESFIDRFESLDAAERTVNAVYVPPPSPRGTR